MGDAPRTVIVTGSSGRVGCGIVDALLARGAAVLLVDIDQPALDTQRAGLPDGASTGSFAVDVTDPSSAEAAFDHAADSFGVVDAIVNNAGIEGPIDRVEDLVLSDVRRVFEVNVFATFAFSQAAMRRFRKQRHGRIVNMASGAGTAGSGLMSPYSASKHAVVGLTRSLAQEAASAGIQVNAVCPGCIDSPMMTRIETRLGEIAGTPPVSFLGGIPAARYCEPAEVGELVAWLALDAPDYINGTAQVIDGAMRS